MRDFLISKLKTLNVKDENKLIEYVDYCISNDKKYKILGTTSHHHILPKAKNLPFAEFSNLTENSWNGVHLLFSEHYYAHWLLYESIKHYSITKSFVAMHNKDIKLGRITEDVLINSKLYECVMIEHSKATSEHMNEIIIDNKKRSQISAIKQWETKRSNGNIGDAKQMNTPESIEKQKQTMLKINPESGLNRYQQAGVELSISLLNRPYIKCPHCGIESKSTSNLTRYHFDNCPVNKKLMTIEEYFKYKTSELLHKGIPEKKPRQKFKQRRGCCLNCKGEFGLSNLKKYHGDKCKTI